MALTPKHCHVRSVALDGRGKAEVRVSCDTTPGRITAEPNRNYTRTVKARELSFRGAHMTGAGQINFVLSPAHAVCKASSGVISCKLVGDTSGASLRGARKRRRR